MPWENKTVEELRREFVDAAKSCTNFSALCREFNITRKTGYKWLERNCTGESLQDKSRKPMHIANKTATSIEDMIVNLRNENPGWGAKKLYQVLKNEGVVDIPCVKTINNILHRHSLIVPEESIKHTAYKRFEKESCNDMWQVDFKGEFRTNDGRYCYPLNIIDDHSRFLIATKGCKSTGNIVIQTFKEVFSEYGLPKAILSDNGAQFAGYKDGYTKFERMLIELDVQPLHGKVRHPQTQGKIERLNRTMNNELLKRQTFKDVEDADNHLQEWRNKYNYVRPHEALGMHCPGDIYEKSNREYSEKVEFYEYSGLYPTIKVNCKGYVRYDGWHFYLSETMAGVQIELRPDYENNILNLCYRNYRIGQYSIADGSRINRKIMRLR